MSSEDGAAAIIPDDKDWTWVLHRRCPECGLDTRTLTRAEIVERLRENAARWPAVLRRPGVRRRPDPGVWSPVEYACHVRGGRVRRELRNHTARVIAAVESGEPVVLTVHGRPVADIGSSSDDFDVHLTTDDMLT